MKIFIICTFIILYLDNQIEKNQIGQSCRTHGISKSAYKISDKIYKGKRSSGRPEHTMENKVKTDNES
jgi:hypothetical protein